MEYIYTYTCDECGRDCELRSDEPVDNVPEMCWICREEEYEYHNR